ncbi:unnamed protein product, partial [Sphagnum balticum]
MLILLLFLLSLTSELLGGGVSSLSLSGSINVSQTLVSPQNVFQLGFYSLQQSNTNSAGGADAAPAEYSLAIWYSQVVPTTLVWMASRDVNLSSSAYLELSAYGVLRLFLSAQNYQAVWQSSNIEPTTTTVKLEDTGNFVLKDAATNTILWQSFDTPTDTLLPGQNFSANMNTSLLISRKAADDWSSGYYQCDWAYIHGTDMPQSLALSWTGASIPNWNRSSWSSTSVSDRNATVYPYWWFDAYPADYAYLGANGTNLYLGNASGEWANLTSTSDQGQGAFTRMTLDRDGGFRLYSFAAGSTGWVVEGNLISDPCKVFATCGAFAICDSNDSYPTYLSTCTCPNGFEPISSTDAHQGCTADMQLPDDQHCNNDTSSKVELVDVGDIDYPYSDRLSNYLTVNETACKQTCMEDCRCAGAVFHRSEQKCFLKGTPLFNGGYTVQVGNRTTYLKILKSPPAGSVNFRIRLVAGICAAAAAAVLFLCGLMCLIGYRRHVISKAVRSKSFMRFDTLGLGPRNFTYKQLSVATRNFSDSELLGRGGMGSVYRGVLRPESIVVAVKRIRDESKKGEQGFLAEATSISQIRHRNLVQLQGWCYEDRNLLLVYDFMSNGSLDQWLYNNTHKAVAAAKAAEGTSSSSSSDKNTKVLSWELRYSILSGVAAALAYLHEECQQCVLHRDIKPSNVMLDEKFEPHLGDFGLARLIDHQKVDKTTMMAGTLGYMAPEMPYTGKATKETDVYSFGILVLEVVCGRHPLEPWNADIPPEDVMLVNKVRRAHKAGKLLSVVDPRIETDSCNVKMRVLQLGLLCSLQEPTARPSMRAVSQILSSSTQDLLHNAHRGSCARLRQRTQQTQAQNQTLLLTFNTNLLLDSATQSLAKIQMIVLRLCILLRLVDAGGGVSSLSLSGSINVSQTLVSQPHGVFQLGFYSLQQSNTSSAGGADAAAAAYSLAIWYSQVVPTTPVWMASRDVLLSSSAYLQLSADGVLRLFLSAQNHQAVWQSSNIEPTTTTPNTITAELEDTGNFVLKDAATNTILWQSFDTPTDTLLPGQKFSANMSTSLLVSWKAADDWSSGYYQCDWAYINGTDMPQSLALSWTGASITNWNRSSWSSTSVSDRNVTVYPYWWFDAYPADYAYLGANGTTFYLGNASGEWANLTSTSDQGQGAFTRMTLDRDGGFRLYSFAAGSSGWVVEGSLLPDPCEVFATCGAFAICSENVTYPTYFSTCTCPMGFVPISVTDPHQGCTAEFQLLDDQYCINDTSSKVELVEVGDIDYPFSDRLSNYLTINETACKQTCMEDCRCAGAVFHRREQMCFLKGTPLFNGGYTVQEGNRSAYLKILTSPLAPSQGAGSVNVRIRLVAGICAAAAAVVLFLCGMMCLIGYRRHVITKAVRSKSSMRFDTLGLGPRNFTYKQLNVATRNFSDSELLGRGGMGSVYRGVLRPENVVVAVKRIRDESKKGEQGFLAEATSISQIRHRNLVQLQGWCYEDRNLLLVYDFMSNGSLDQWLYNNTHKARSKYARGLSWELRYSILSGVAAALAYLHEEWQQCVLHRDIKPSNVMLDAEFNAHLGDFGLARLVDHQKVEKTTMMAGTLGYMAPEMPYTGKATKETDVYSFGVLVLEVVCGRHPVDTMSLEIEPDDVLLVNRVRRAHDAGKLLSVQEICIESEQKSLVLRLGLLCSLPQPSARPSMRVVKQVLSSAHSSPYLIWM